MTVLHAVRLEDFLDVCAMRDCVQILTRICRDLLLQIEVSRALISGDVLFVELVDELLIVAQRRFVVIQVRSYVVNYDGDISDPSQVPG